ncbi:MAG TPA: PilZ domain-containing protein [Terriglobales bacterium]|nr:PilZ domain-containing protein [Terriglobales bacterium]
MAQAQAERRGEQRFPLRLPVVVKSMHGGVQEESSLTRDVSARGAFFYLDGKLAEGTPVELILTLPAEITLTDSIRVRCKGRVVRVVGTTNGGKTGVAATIDQYDFATESDPLYF